MEARTLLEGGETDQGRAMLRQRRSVLLPERPSADRHARGGAARQEEGSPAED
ncbi:hypothetical protein [Actinopolyspora erythraea]|uniref:hypothetical protein n=1 Tax=Actinopolyspora erythraea TaxID=414996 RepID=UPI000A88AA5A|nr:hypothetical protein [Actinopolyspora erythraea]